MKARRFLLLSALLVVASACKAKPVPGGDFVPSPQAAPDPAAIVNGLKTAGAPIGRIESYNAETDPARLLGRPGQYIGKTVWEDTRYPIKAGTPENQLAWAGTIETFSSASDLKAWKKKIQQLHDMNPTLPPEYQAEKGLALLRMDHVLTPDQAKAYETAFQQSSG
jgi:hypothetical protein